MESVTCKKCAKPLPDAEQRWNRARECPDCRGKAMADHALTQPVEEDE